MAAITLRSIKGSPLTNLEIDNNFSNINTELGTATSDIDDINLEIASLNLDVSGINSDIGVIEAVLPTKLDSASYTAADVRTKLITVDGPGSGIDADTLDGQHGSFYAPINSPTLTGNPLAPTRTTTDNTTSIATTAFVQANAALKVSKAGDTMTGPLVLSGNADDPLEAVPLQQLQNPIINSLNGGQLGGFRNKIINGAMNIAQRGVTFVGLGTSDGFYTLDRWRYSARTSALGNLTQGTSVPTNSGFTSSLSYTVTTADTSIAADDYLAISQIFEANNCRDLIGKTFTLSFWVRSPVVGTYFIRFGNATATNVYVTSYQILSANIWEKKSITIVGGLLTSGSWGTGSNFGVMVSWILAAGSSFHGTANVWGTTNISSTNAQVNALGTSGNNFVLTGVQLEEGTVATPFEHRDFNTEISTCRRYFEKTFAYGTAPAQNTSTSSDAYTFSGTVVAGQSHRGEMWQFSTHKRAIPTTVTTYNPLATNGNVRNLTRASDANIFSIAANQIGVVFSCTAPASSVAGDIYTVHITADSEL